MTKITLVRVKNTERNGRVEWGEQIGSLVRCKGMYMCKTIEKRLVVEEASTLFSFPDFKRFELLCT